MPDATTGSHRPGAEVGQCASDCRSAVEGAAHTMAPAIQHVSMDLRGAYIGMTEQLLDGTDVIAAFDQVCRKRMPQGVCRHPFRQARLPGSALDRALQGGFVKVVPLQCSSSVDQHLSQWPLSTSRGLP